MRFRFHLLCPITTETSAYNSWTQNQFKQKSSVSLGTAGQAESFIYIEGDRNAMISTSTSSDEAALGRRSDMNKLSTLMILLLSASLITAGCSGDASLAVATTSARTDYVEVDPDDSSADQWDDDEHNWRQAYDVREVPEDISQIKINYYELDPDDSSADQWDEDEHNWRQAYN